MVLRMTKIGRDNVLLLFIKKGILGEVYLTYLALFW